MNNENSELETEQPETASAEQDAAASTGTDEPPIAEIVDQIASEAPAQSDDEGDASATIESLRAEIAEAEKRALLHQADLENFRRRKSKESQDAIRYSSLPLINGILEVVDNLHRALESAREDEGAASLREGVEIVAAQMIATLESHGCKKIEALGQVFDPNRHEAIQMQPGEEPLNTIIMEVQTGFTLHDRVVRPAKVIISTGPADKK